jgi:hypothetical protein
VPEAAVAAGGECFVVVVVVVVVVVKVVDAGLVLVGMGGVGLVETGIDWEALVD